MTVTENPHKFKDPHAQAISDKWFPLQETATIEQKNSIGFLYISKFLGLGDEVAQKFVQGELGSYNTVGMKQGSIPMDTDVRPFWQEVVKVFPGLLTNEDIDFLSEKGGVFGVLQFTYHLDPIAEEESPLLRSLAINAHLYK